MPKACKHMEASSSAMSASLGMTYIGLGGRDTVNSLLEEWGEEHRQIPYWRNGGRDTVKFLIGGMGGGTPSNSLLEEWGGGTPSIRYTVNSLYIGEGTVNSLGWHLGSGYAHKTSGSADAASPERASPLAHPLP